MHPTWKTANFLPDVTQHYWGHTWNPVLVSSVQDRHEHNEEEGQWRWLRDWSITPMRKGRQNIFREERENWQLSCHLFCQECVYYLSPVWGTTLLKLPFAVSLSMDGSKIKTFILLFTLYYEIHFNLRAAIKQALQGQVSLRNHRLQLWNEVLINIFPPSYKLGLTTSMAHK